jgi:hypothetical protein
MRQAPRRVGEPAGPSGTSKSSSEVFLAPRNPEIAFRRLPSRPEARKALRPRIEKELPSFDLAAFDKLEDYAWALSYAQSLYLTATQPPGELAEDLQILAIAMQANWAKIQGKAPTTAADLDTALRMSARLMRIVGLREQGPAQLAAATDQRLRAFTLVLNVYDDARRAVGYLRAREDDADSIAPALHPGRPRRKQPDPPAPTANTPPSPAMPPATPTGTAPSLTATSTGAGTDATKTASGNSQGPFVS